VLPETKIKAAVTAPMLGFDEQKYRLALAGVRVQAPVRLGRVLGHDEIDDAEKSAHGRAHRPAQPVLDVGAGLYDDELKRRFSSSK